MNKLLIFLLLCGCSQLEKTEPVSDTAHTVPGWVYAPYEACVESEELCATGEARTFVESDAQAKNNLASIFEVQIKSDLNVNTTSSQAMPWQNEVRQEVQQSLQESVNQVLETVQIKKHFKKEGLSYALAALDRQKAAELLGGRLDKLDHDLKALWSRKQRTNIRKITRIIMEREKLNERYSIVSGSPRPSIVAYEDFLAWRDSRPVPVALSLKVGQAPEWMVEKVRELLSESGFQFVKGDSKKVLSMHVDSIQEFLNVEGFEKYTFTLNLTSIENGEKNKVLTKSVTVTGRTQADALLKVKNLFNEYLEQNLADLHLD
ncbi:MAG TPA: LPP20 family lipoprotein [Bacteriovoracaceae bacterium]|nr:LPP20 family lipoprotein [Bacteriovoracaceae bacterium]